MTFDTLLHNCTHLLLCKCIDTARARADLIRFEHSSAWKHNIIPSGGAETETNSNIVYISKYILWKTEKPCIFGVFIYSWASKHPCSHAHRTLRGENKCRPTDQAIRRWMLTLFLRACTQIVFFHAVDSSKIIRSSGCLWLGERWNSAMACGQSWFPCWRRETKTDHNFAVATLDTANRHETW